MTEEFKPLDKKKEFTPNKYILPFYYEEDLKEHIRLLNYNFVLKCSNAKDYNKFRKILIKIFGKELTNG